MTAEEVAETEKVAKSKMESVRSDEFGMASAFMEPVAGSSNGC